MWGDDFNQQQRSHRLQSWPRAGTCLSLGIPGRSSSCRLTQFLYNPLCFLNTEGLRSQEKQEENHECRTNEEHLVCSFINVKGFVSWLIHGVLTEIRWDPKPFTFWPCSTTHCCIQLFLDLAPNGWLGRLMNHSLGGFTLSPFGRWLMERKNPTPH